MDAHYEERLAAIEVYPAATLRSRGIYAKSYKKPEQVAERQLIIRAMLEAGITLDDVATMEVYVDALDAAVCVVAAADFLQGLALEPTDPALASKEGWIWVRPPSLQS